MSSLSDQVARLNDRRSAFIDAVDAPPREHHSRRPGPERWAASEVTEHVYKSESGILQWLERQLSPEGTPRIIGRPSLARFAGLMLAIRSPMKFKVPPGAVSAVPIGLSYEEIRADWIGFADRWEAVVASFPTDLATTGLVRHPIIGPMTLIQSVQFLSAHAERHFQQLERTIKWLSQ